MKFLLSALLLAAALPTQALTLSNTQSLGHIGDTDTDPGVAFAFDLGGSFSSISSVQFVFDPCDFCQDTIGTAEDVVLHLGADSFVIGNVGLGNTVTRSLTFSPSLASELLDGKAAGFIWLHEQPGFDFHAAVSSAEITLKVEGIPAVPEPEAFALWGAGLAALAMAGVRRCASGESMLA